MRRGFTLLEIMVVLVVLGILVSMGIPQYLTAIEKARVAEAVSILGTIRQAQLRYRAQTGSYPTNPCNFAVVIDNCDLDITIRALRFFNRPARGIIATNLGSISRIVGGTNPGFGDYTLSINEAGDIACAGGAVNACARIGY